MTDVSEGLMRSEVKRGTNQLHKDGTDAIAIFLLGNGLL
jgi:hypothetical protein